MAVLVTRTTKEKHMNHAARIGTVEVKLNDDEMSILDQIRGGLGRSPFFRDLMHKAARTHGKPPAPPKESRHCPGLGRPACRARGAKGGARRNL
jgi:hypothetical protein